ncbi:MAG TPA: cupin domain-containing protein [Phenylobacterium sp.]|nr:cupin domain-containing protein [Phenylobacterium sp.]
MTDRPAFIAHWRDLENDKPNQYRGSDEPLAFNASLARKLGLARIGIHHVRVPPGRRISYPHAESAEEEFVFVIEGRPDAWIDGVLYALEPGDSVAFPAGTGICHTFLNNTPDEVRLIVVGEKDKEENRIHYPLNPELEAMREDRWVDPPTRLAGNHDGRPRLRQD